MTGKNFILYRVGKSTVYDNRELCIIILQEEARLLDYNTHCRPYNSDHTIIMHELQYLAGAGVENWWNIKSNRNYFTINCILSKVAVAG